jgi:hypothetical protein
MRVSLCDQQMLELSGKRIKPLCPFVLLAKDFSSSLDAGLKAVGARLSRLPFHTFSHTKLDRKICI